MNIFITGITGTIGTAFVDLLKDKHTISGVDRNEQRIAVCKAKYPDVEILTGEFSDVRLPNKKIDLVIHLAAMKHIDLCESNPTSCVINNVLRTHNFLRECHRAAVRDLLFMSTDKAVEPTSVYGYSKALAEAMVAEQGWAVARSGNVIGSNGSVFEKWDNAIANNEPVTLTHKDVRRYFISPENLVERIWEAYANGDRLIIPEMDSHEKMHDILKRKLEHAGKDIKTYPVTYTGLRKGEKLEEKLQ